MRNKSKNKAWVEMLVHISTSNCPLMRCGDGSTSASVLLHFQVSERHLSLQLQLSTGVTKSAKTTTTHAEAKPGEGTRLVVRLRVLGSASITLNSHYFCSWVLSGTDQGFLAHQSPTGHLQTRITTYQSRRKLLTHVPKPGC